LGEICYSIATTPKPFWLFFNPLFRTVYLLSPRIRKIFAACAG
jgi:hypothetical protein